MKEIRVKLKERSYAIHIQSTLLDEAGALARQALGNNAHQAIILSNATVAALYGKRLQRSFTDAGFRVQRFLIGDGERYKNLQTAEALYKFLIEQQVERADVVVALGGGVVGDVAGFVAATYLRGIRFVQIPTTLLAQIDSSVGGKTGVNHALGKNLIGAFHQPALVVIDPETLRSLPPRERHAGLHEAIKYGVIKDRRLFQRIARDLDLLNGCDSEALAQLIARCCEIKARVVEQDEREGDLRRILNFGHTVGHALEAVTHYRRFLHGEAVGQGMRVAARIAERAGLLAADERQHLDEVVLRVGRLPTTKNLALRDIMKAMQRDKKAAAGRLAFVLPVTIGRVVIKTDLPLPLIRSSIKETLL
ncbi:MAG: 3-dehydroquinate synthase [Acidobacteria bacterium]|nr:3-dehydroquinate synthase [Acidobacteriota bacterium]